MNHLEALDARFKATTLAGPGAAKLEQYVPVDARDLRALLDAVRAAATLPEPHALSRGRMLCVLCRVDLGRGSHAVDCPWRLLQRALEPWRKEGGKK